jgi:hypothetical protein
MSCFYVRYVLDAIVITIPFSQSKDITNIYRKWRYTLENAIRKGKEPISYPESQMLREWLFKTDRKL